MEIGPCSSRRIAIVVPAKRLQFLAGLLWIQRYGPLQVASCLKDAGYRVQLFNEELGARVTARELAAEYDIVGFSSKTCAMSRATQLARQVKAEAAALGRTVTTILGGEHACMCEGARLPECFDHVLAGEAEEFCIALVNALQQAEKGASEILNHGAAGGLRTCRSFDNIPDLSLVAGYKQTASSFLFRYARPLWIVKNRRFPMLSFQGSRGCPYGCAFCPTPRYLQGKQYRRRTGESAATCLKEHIAYSGISRVMFEDPTAALPFDPASHQFFSCLARHAIPMRASILVRLDLCYDQELLAIMRAAGVTNLSIGIESLSDETRRDFKKRISDETILQSIQVFRQYGFSLTGLFIVGYDTDDLNSFDRIEGFIHQTGIERWRVSPITQMPETDGQFMPAHRFFRWDELDRFGRDLIDYTNGEFVLFFPMHCKPSELQQKIFQFNRSSTSLTAALKMLPNRRQLLPFLQRCGNNLAHRLADRQPVIADFIQMLRVVEAPFYEQTNGQLRLNEALLRDRFQRRDPGRPCQEQTSAAAVHFGRTG